MTVPTSDLNAKPSFLRRSWIWILALLVVAAGAGAYYYFYYAPQGAGQAAQDGTKGGPGKGKGKGRFGDRPVPVIATAAKTGDVNVYLAGLGSVTPVATVAVRSRVDGQLMSVLFKEGQVVRAGELLAEIDPRPYQVQLATAEGQMARDQALLKNARIDLERYRVLLQQDSIAKQQYDTQEALVRQYEATVKIDQAAIDTAKLQLTYCRVTAPVGGRLGLRQVDAGNIVRAGDATGLVVIAQLQPITVVFTIPEDSLPPVMAKLRAGQKLPVDAYDRADKAKLASGMLLTADNQIDPATGTVKLKAQFPNADNALFPSQFANVRMLVDVKRDAVLVPSAAVQRGTPGTFVYVVGAEGTVSVRRVKLGPAQGESVSVESGLAAGEMVVVDGADKLREGAKVDASTREAGSGKGGFRKGPPGAEGKAPAAGGERAKGAPGAAASQGTTPPPSAATGGGGGGGWQGLSPEERAKRWADVNARIDRGEFGEEIKKLPEEERKQRMRELRQKREAAGGNAQ